MYYTSIDRCVDFEFKLHYLYQRIYDPWKIQENMIQEDLISFPSVKGHKLTLCNWAYWQNTLTSLSFCYSGTASCNNYIQCWGLRHFSKLCVLGGIHLSDFWKNHALELAVWHSVLLCQKFGMSLVGKASTPSRCEFWTYSCMILIFLPDP